MTEMQKEYIVRLEEERLEELAKAENQIEAFKISLDRTEVLLSELVFDYCPTTGISTTYPGLLQILAPELEPTKDGLFSVGDLMEQLTIPMFSEGDFRANNFICFSHPFFRRSYSLKNNYAPHFLSVFLRYASSCSNSTLLALDENRVRIDVDGGGYMERDTWYGAPFDQNISQISDGNVKLAVPPEFDDLDRRLFCSSVVSMSIRWSTSGNIKTFYAESFKDSDVLIEYADDLFHPAKYIHAEYDLTRECFTHMDGAIHMYGETEYLERVHSDINHNDKSDFQIKGKSKKLFRIDGEIKQEDWSNLCCHFMAKNPLMIEYFTGSLPEHIQEVRAKLNCRVRQ